MDSKNINRTDWLALERTKLANERTFLAYFRTFIVMTSSGVAVLKIQALQNLESLGYFFIAAGIVLLLMGILRFFYVRKQIRKYFD